MRWGEAKHAPDVTGDFRSAGCEAKPRKAVSPSRELSPFTLRLHPTD
jgi:hypothetical protein